MKDAESKIELDKMLRRDAKLTIFSGTKNTRRKLNKKHIKLYSLCFYLKETPSDKSRNEIKVFSAGGEK